MNKGMKIIRVLILINFLALITIGGCSTSNNVFMVEIKKGEKLSIQTDFNQYFGSESTKSDTCKFSPINFITIVNDVSDTVSLKLYSLSQNKTMEFFKDFMQKGNYYININELKLPKATYIMNYSTKGVNVNQGFCN
jgi:hypothetical protein